MSEQLRHRFHGVRKAVGEGARDGDVQLATAAPEERAVRRVANERVLEDVGCIRRESPSVEQLGVHQAGESLVEIRHRRSGDRLEQTVRELASDRRPDLRDASRRPEAVEASRQQILERRRHLALREAPRRVGHETRQLFREQRHTVAPRDERLDELRQSDRLTARDHLSHVLPAESVQGHGRQVRTRRPRAPELRAGRVQQQHRRRRRLLPEELEQLDRRGVGPHQVLDDQHGRLDRGRCEEPAGEGRHQALALLRRRAGEWRVAPGRQWESDQASQQGHALSGIEAGRGQRPLEEDEPLLRRFVALPGETLLDHLDHAEEGSAGVIRRGGALDPRLGIVRRCRPGTPAGGATFRSPVHR